MPKRGSIIASKASTGAFFSLFLSLFFLRSKRETRSFVLSFSLLEMKGPGGHKRRRKNREINKRENNNSICVRSMNGIKINFLLVTYRLSSNASFLTFATDRTRSVSFES